jgi:hypothetical protein
MSFSDGQIELLQNLYNDTSLGLTTGQKMYNYLKSNGETGYTLSKVNEYLNSDFSSLPESDKITKITTNTKINNVCTFSMATLLATRGPNFSKSLRAAMVLVLGTK